MRHTSFVLTALALLFLSGCKSEDGFRSRSSKDERAVFGERSRADEQSGKTPERSATPKVSERKAASNAPNGEPAPAPVPQANPKGAVVGDPGERSELALSGRLQDPQSSKDEIAAVLQRWVETLAGRNLDGHMDLYAPMLVKYNGKRNVSKESVRQQKQRFLSENPVLDRYEIRELSVAPAEGGQLLAAFQSQWVARGNPSANGSARERVTFRRQNGAWKIIGEEQLQTISGVR